MAKFGRVENGIVMEVAEFADQAEINSKFHADIASQWVEDPNNEIEERWSYNGTVFSAPAGPAAPTVAQVKKECNRRIAMSDHDWQCLRNISDGTPVDQALKDYAADCRTSCATLEASLPVDYRDDIHWPALPV